MYKHRNCPYAVRTVAASAQGDALLIQVYTQETNYGIAVVHAPHAKKVGHKGYSMHWLDFWDRVRPQVDPGSVIVVGDVNSAFHRKDRAVQQPDDTGWRRICSNHGLLDLRQLVRLPTGTWSCMAGEGSRIDTAALTTESSLRVSQAHHWRSTLLSDHHYPLMLMAHVPEVCVDKPEPTGWARLPEAHMAPVDLTVDQQFQYATEVHDRDRGNPETYPRGFIRRLQMAMYKWAKDRKYTKVRRFDKGELEQRPDEETRRDIGGPPMEHPEEMLPSVPDFIAALRKEMGDPGASERKIKTQFTKLTTQVNREATEARDREKRKARLEGEALGRAPDTWGYVRRSLQIKRPKTENFLLDSKVLMNNREVLARIRRARQELQGVDYQISADARRWSVYQQYVQAMPQRAVQPLRNYIKPAHLWQVTAGKARGRDLEVDGTHVLIDITWYRSLSDADQRDLCKALESPAVLRHLGKQGTLILLVKNANLPATDDNVRGITLGTHLSKVPLAAFFATRGTEAYENALGGPYLVGGISGISLVEVVRTVVMTTDVLQLIGTKQFFDRIPKESHPTAGPRIGLGTREELDTQAQGFTTVTPLGETPADENARGAPQGTVQGCHVENRCALPLMHAINQMYSSHAANILRTIVKRYVDDAFNLLVEFPEHRECVPQPAQGVVVDTTTYT